MTEPNLINLEDSDPAPPAPPVAPPQDLAPPEAPPAEPVVDDPDEAAAIDTPTGKHVPLGVVLELRTQLSQAKKALAQVPQLQQQMAQLQGQVQTFQSLQTALQPPTAPPVPASDDPELIDLARSLDYYKQDGTPDTARAVKHQQIIERFVDRRTETRMQPMQQSMHQQKSTANFYAVVNQATARGIQIDQQNLWNIWQTLPPDVTADPRAAFTVLTSALGAQMLTKTPQPPPVGRPPIHTENVGNAPPRNPATLTAHTKANINGRMDEKKYTDLTKDFKPGRTNVLEED